MAPAISLLSTAQRTYLVCFKEGILYVPPLQLSHRWACMMSHLERSSPIELTSLLTSVPYAHTFTESKQRQDRISHCTDSNVDTGPRALQLSCPACHLRSGRWCHIAMDNCKSSSLAITELSIIPRFSCSEGTNLQRPRGGSRSHSAP